MPYEVMTLPETMLTIINQTLRNIFQCDFISNVKVSFERYTVENVICKMLAILFRLQYVVFVHSNASSYVHLKTDFSHKSDKHYKFYIDGWVQDCYNSSAKALELPTVLHLAISIIQFLHNTTLYLMQCHPMQLRVAGSMYSCILESLAHANGSTDGLRVLKHTQHAYRWVCQSLE